MFSPETYAMAKKYTDDHGGESPRWSAVQDKPFSTIGGGLTVDDDGALNADVGGTTKAMVVTYDDDTTETFNVFVEEN